MTEEKMLELIEDVAGLKVGMASIEEKLDELSHRLLGNGQPGLIADLQSTDRILAEKIEQVEKKGEKLAGIWIGGSGVVVIIFTLIEFLFRK